MIEYVSRMTTRCRICVVILVSWKGKKSMFTDYLRHRLASGKGIVVLGVCVCVRRAATAPRNPVLSSLHLQWRCLFVVADK